MLEISPITYVLTIIALVIRIAKDAWNLIDRWRRRK